MIRSTASRAGTVPRIDGHRGFAPSRPAPHSPWMLWRAGVDRRRHSGAPPRQKRTSTSEPRRRGRPPLPVRPETFEVRARRETVHRNGVGAGRRGWNAGWRPECSGAPVRLLGLKAPIRAAGYCTSARGAIVPTQLRAFTVARRARRSWRHATAGERQPRSRKSRLNGHAQACADEQFAGFQYIEGEVQQPGGRTRMTICPQNACHSP
ncbi:hypothetical protein EV667_3750 [Ancylobacter aquaticus]|uniref:Uncharacterized protein n=1 Tax=Ancylobacter aquaticus TaxID=100 RepID=A0A4R1HQR6_ANCAQ|nr:hypothetical protein EV667_3750 [Ancylobacter aquaticus]